MFTSQLESVSLTATTRPIAGHECNVRSLVGHFLAWRAAWPRGETPRTAPHGQEGPVDAKRAVAADLKIVGDKRVPFAALTANLWRHDICRRFLAALQLANEDRLAIHHANNADDLPHKLDFSSNLPPRPRRLTRPRCRRRRPFHLLTPSSPSGTARCFHPASSWTRGREARRRRLRRCERHSLAPLEIPVTIVFLGLYR
mmetsp:Transcript_2629/g.8207  ORF Transcript_2629/g.8207 Transcript_2629/m.8207 type:complete len:200 (+) Transcript_2629:156-755(+)